DHDVWMVERSRRPCFLLESAALLVVVRAGRKQFDRDIARKPQIATDEYAPHTTGADFALQGIASSKDGAVGFDHANSPKGACSPVAPASTARSHNCKSCSCH